MKEVFDGVFTEPIPLTGNPLKAINNFLIRSEGECLMVDTAFYNEETTQAMERILQVEHIDPETLRLFLTHLHSDHTGLASWFEQRGTRLLMGEADGRAVQEMTEPDSSPWSNVRANARLQGLVPDGLKLEDHPGFRFRPLEKFHYQVTRPGEVLEVGAFRFEVLDLKGHTPGLQGLWDKEKRILFSGDHVLAKITPNITFWGLQHGDILGTYLQNLKKVYELDPQIIFSSHRSLVTEPRARIKELLAHHEERLQEALGALEQCPMTVRDVTKQLSWDIRAKNWDDFPKSQKWFAAGEAQAHLEHLLASGLVKRTEENGVLFYEKA